MIAEMAAGGPLVQLTLVEDPDGHTWETVWMDQAAMAGADAVVNCVGVLAQQGRNTFDALQHQGAARIARARLSLQGDSL